MLRSLSAQKKERAIIAGMIVYGGTMMSLLSRYHGGEYFDYQVANGKGYTCTLKGRIKQPQIVELKKIMGE